MKILITGGAGYIGSHTLLEVIKAGHQAVVVDNLVNGHTEAVSRVGKLTNTDIKFVAGDIRDKPFLERIFTEFTPDAVMHFAGLKAVGESVTHPLDYWDVNVCGSRQLLAAMQRAGCQTVVFSSSATLYGIPDLVPIPESAEVRPINPYGHSKAAVERILTDLAASEPGWRIACLRYFNPVGAHPSGHLGEDPNGIPNNLFPFVSQVAVGRRSQLSVFGGDWPTPDGSCLRDYIHVMDLAEGHRAAVDVLLDEDPQLLTLNLGSGQGHSVLEVVAAFEQASGQSIPYEVVARRPGDAAITMADPSLAAERLRWRTKRGLSEMCRDGWAWQSANPQGYAS